ncbi:MAG: glycosyltransferase [Candidatus Omnitrophica bacterium]|nr:glycosyltransferase [Candidatus Omnitrophota bacterium]
MKISFIIATVNRDQELQQCITSIEKAHECKQDVPIEILVVVQKAKEKKDIRIHYPEITTFYYIDRIGLSIARNFAIEKCLGDYCVFLDDDAAVNQDFIDVLSKKVITYKKVSVFCGRLMDSAQGVPFSVLFNNNNVRKLSRFDFQYFMGSAHVIAKETIKRIGCYDERFGVGAKYRGSEETDLFFRLKASSEQVLYLPELIFFHPIPITPPEYVYNYAYAIGAMLTKSCFNDKAHFIVYFYIFFLRIIKAYIRILQKIILKGIYQKKDEKYHYSSILRGTYGGMKDFIKSKFIFQRKICL